VHAAAAAPCSTPVIAAGDIPCNCSTSSPSGRCGARFQPHHLNVCTNPIQHQITLTWPNARAHHLRNAAQRHPVGCLIERSAGAFAYNPAPERVAGRTHTLAVAFTPTTRPTTRARQQPVQLTVNRAPVTVTLTPNPGSNNRRQFDHVRGHRPEHYHWNSHRDRNLLHGTSTLARRTCQRSGPRSPPRSQLRELNHTASYPGDTDFLPAHPMCRFSQRAFRVNLDFADRLAQPCALRYCRYLLRHGLQPRGTLRVVFLL